MLKKYILGSILGIMSVMDANAMMGPVDPNWVKPDYIKSFPDVTVNSRCPNQYYVIEPKDLITINLPLLPPQYIGRNTTEDKQIAKAYSHYDICVACLERAEREKKIQNPRIIYRSEIAANKALTTKIENYKNICPRLMIG